MYNMMSDHVHKWISRFVSIKHCDFFKQGLYKSKKPYPFIISVSDFQHNDLYYNDYAFKVFKEVSEERKEVLRWRKFLSAV